MVEEDSSYKAGVGPERATVNAMARKSKDEPVSKERLKKVVELLKFVLTLDDEEIVKSTIESVIELLEEENSK